MGGFELGMAEAYGASFLVFGGAAYICDRGPNLAAWFAIVSGVSLAFLAGVTAAPFVVH